MYFFLPSTRVVIQEIPLPLVLRDGYGHILQVADNTLYQSRGIDEPQYTVAVDKAVHQLFTLAEIGVYGNTADTLTG